VVFFRRYSDNRPPHVSLERRKELQLFEKQIGIRFRNIGLLNLAFCHRSYANEIDIDVDNNEKLEFLGDSVLGLVVSEYLFTAFKDQSEGEMAKIKSFVVSEASLAKIAKQIKVDNFILIGRGEEYSGGRSKRAIIADCLEAIIGAYYLDSGLKMTRDFVLNLLVPEIDAVRENRHQKDYKTLLQEFAQKKFKTYPRYKTVKKRGPDHDRTFWIEVSINDRCFGPGVGKNKKEAEQQAAGIAYDSLKKEVAKKRSH
jgi:ribonuclease-3